MCRKTAPRRLSTMTAASRSGGVRRLTIRVFARNCAVACGLQIAALALSACVVPIPAEQAEDPDGGFGKNGYPVITDVTPTMPGPLVIDTKHAQSVTFFLSDADIGDTLYLRIFRDPDLGNVLTVRDKIIPPGSDEQRMLLTDTDGWCAGASQTATHVYDVVVADRMWIDFRTPGPGGKSSTRSWLVQCTTSP